MKKRTEMRIVRLKKLFIAEIPRIDWEESIKVTNDNYAKSKLSAKEYELKVRNDCLNNKFNCF